MKIKTTLLLITSLTQIGLCSAQHNNQEIMDSVDKSMTEFLGRIPGDLLMTFGINSKNELENAKAGVPVTIYNIQNDTLVSTKTWRVPLVIDNKYRALFTVVEDTTGYRIVDFGATLLAQKLFEAKKMERIEGLLRVYELQSDFIMCGNSKGEFEFLPVRDLHAQKTTLSKIISVSNDKQ